MKRLRIFGVLAAMAAATLATIFWNANRPGRRGRAPAELSLPEVAKSPFLNTGPSARYIGHRTCLGCHPDSHESYASSTMSRSLAEVDPAREPDDAVYDHQASGQRSEVYRRDGQLRQRDVLTGAGDSPDELLADYPLKYVVGSGHFSKTYLAEIDGFLVEAPLTWYAATGKWGMSPGFDHAAHPGFEREASERCVSCHAGQIELVDRSMHKIIIHEQAIGCERCHGPGSLHVDFWRSHRGQPAREATGGPIDYTIVNPAHLSRELAAAVCEQCHLTNNAQVTVRGRSLSEFRPGLPLQDYLVTYRLEGPEHSMTVVGHVDQLCLSRCYQMSETLTCIVCHDPHLNPAPAEKVTYFRSICLSCHKSSDCRVDPAQRAVESADNDCTRCHMPKTSTEVVHLAFTHHRIGVHKPSPAGAASPNASREGPGVEAELAPLHDLSRLGEVDRMRSLGLSYFELAQHGGPHSLVCRERARELLEHVRSLGLREGQVDAALAHLVGSTGDPLAPVYAASALEDTSLPAASRALALFILANSHLQKGNADEAARLLHDLMRLRRNSQESTLLGNCEAARGNFAAAREAFERAVSINPRTLPAQYALARLYAQEGNEDQARKHRAIAERMEKFRKRAVQKREFD